MKTTFTILLIFLTSFAFAQKNFVTGHYITPDGEKVEAQINDKNWEKNPSYIEISQNGDIIRLAAADIKGFVLSTGDVFEAFIVDVDKSPTRLNQMVPNAQPVIVRDTVFLRAILKGPTSLYYLRDENAKEHYYFRKGESLPEELINRTKKYDDGVNSGYLKLPFYRGQLTAHLTDCPEVSRKIERLGYTREALEDIIGTYNRCLGSTTGEYTASEEKISWDIMALAGVSINSMNFESKDFKALTRSEFSQSGYTAGISMLATLPRLRGKWAVQGDLMYRNFSAEGSYTERSSPSAENYTITDTKFDLCYLGINAAVRYKIFDGKLQPYIKAGFSNSFIVSDNSTQRVFRKFYSSETTRNQKPLNEFRKYEQALQLSAGMALNRLSAEVRVERGNGLSPYEGLKSARSSFMLLLGYTLF